MHDPQHTGCYDCFIPTAIIPPTPPIIPSIKSLINNTGSISISGYLLMKVQKFESGNWTDKKIVVDDLAGSNLRTIQPNAYLALDTIWAASGGYNASETGTFRAYAELRNATGGAMSAKEGLFKASYVFGII